MWCPDGHGEFRPGVGSCVDCGAELVAGRPVDESAVDVPMTVIAGADLDSDEASLVLRAAGIEHHWGGGDLAVPDERFEEARGLLETVGPAQRPGRVTTSVPRFRFAASAVWWPTALAFNSALFAMWFTVTGATGLDRAANSFAGIGLLFAVLALPLVPRSRRHPDHRRAAWVLVAAVVMAVISLVL